jgi:hypothetical protein
MSYSWTSSVHGDNKQYEYVKTGKVQDCAKHVKGERYHALLMETRTWASVGMAVPPPIHALRIFLYGQLQEALESFLRLDCVCWEILSQRTLSRGASWASVEEINDVAVLSDLAEEDVWND